VAADAAAGLWIGGNDLLFAADWRAVCEPLGCSFVSIVAAAGAFPALRPVSTLVLTGELEGEAFRDDTGVVELTAGEFGCEPAPPTRAEDNIGLPGC
jgi:hypothetical protein